MKRTSRIQIGQAIKVRHNEDQTEASVVDISYGGIRVKSDLKPEIGDDVTIIHTEAGELVGKVVRYTTGGFALEFGESEFSANFALQSITSEMHSDSSSDEQE